MSLKKQTVLPPGTVITRCPPGVANATPLRVLREEAEQAAARGESRIPLSAGQREEKRAQAAYEGTVHAAECLMEDFADARFSGLSTEDALDYANGY